MSCLAKAFNFHENESFNQHSKPQRKPYDDVAFLVHIVFHCVQIERLFTAVTSRLQEERMVGSGEELKVISKCFSSIDVTSNKSDASRLTNGDPSNYWQSDGAARSHFIRFPTTTTTTSDQSKHWKCTAVVVVAGCA